MKTLHNQGTFPPEEKYEPSYASDRAAAFSDAKSVFEVVDATSNEQFYPLGIFYTIAEAENAIAKCRDPADFGTPLEYEDFFAVEIRERKLGWRPYWKVMKRIEWERAHDEPADEYRWNILP